MKPKPPANAQLALFSADNNSEDEFSFPLVIKRSPRRKTIEIIIRTGEVQLMLPTRVGDAEGKAFVRDKEDWILQTIAKHKQHENEIVPKRYQEGEPFEFLGKSYPLKIYLAKKASVQLLNDSLYVGIKASAKTDKAERVKKALWQWYQEQALQILTEKTNNLTARIKRQCQGIQLRRTKSKWGHCTSEGYIQFNWQIIAAPEKVVDYLVAHEVSHLVHANHGVRFWRHVEKLFPDYKSHQTWLKLNGHTLTV
ncbi:SprT family zinc-dependent metalloprotease [Aurantivibrio infirmus]